VSASDPLPAWSTWNPVGAERPWTVGVEEEVMLLAPPGWTLVNRVDDVLADLPPGLPGRASAETHACAVELATRPHARVGDVAGDLRRLRRALAGTLARAGLRAGVSGTHPSAIWNEVETSSGPRYERIHASMRELAHREPTFALHIHVAVPDGDTAVRALAGLRQELPLLLALSANSPYWQGRDTGLASARAPIFSMFPRIGIPRRFASYRAYVRTVDFLVRAGAVPDPSFLWWDARLQPRLGTIEVRMMDGQTRAAEAAALAAFVQCLVRLYAEGAEPAPPLEPEALAENRFLAARDGVAARFLVPGPPRLRPALARLTELLDACRPLSIALGCRAELAAIAALAANPGHDRQRAIADDRGLLGLIAALGAAFAPAERVVTV
jgi:glutamate---cysteine ligase / carboxylate-amine ligase